RGRFQPRLALRPQDGSPRPSLPPTRREPPQPHFPAYSLAVLHRLTLLLLISSFTLHAQTLEVTPNRVMMDEVATIRATGLQPNEHVSIHAELIDGSGDQWSSQADFVADSQGAVDTSKQPPIAGSYKKDASA